MDIASVIAPPYRDPFPGTKWDPGPLSLIGLDGRGHQLRYQSAKSVAALGTSSVRAPPYRDLFPGPGLDQGPPSRTSLNQQHRQISSNSRQIAHSPSRRPTGEEKEEATAAAQSSLQPPQPHSRQPPPERERSTWWHSVSHTSRSWSTHCNRDRE